MKSRRDDSSKAAAKVAEEWASKAMKEAEEAIKRAEVQDDDKDEGPAKCFAIFKAQGFGMLEAMSQVRDRWRRFVFFAIYLFACLFGWRKCVNLALIMRTMRTITHNGPKIMYEYIPRMFVSRTWLWL